MAAPYYYVDWTSANIAGGAAQGTLIRPWSPPVTASLTALLASGGPGTLFNVQLDCSGANIDYWNPDTPFISSQVSNEPHPCDIVQLSSGGLIMTMTFSQPVQNPIMAISSLGRQPQRVYYEFNAPFTILSSDYGWGYYGGGPDALQQEPGNRLWGEEGHGTIAFTGAYSSISWTVTDPETWSGFTFGAAGVPEPGAWLLAGTGLVLVWAARRRT